MPKKIGLDLEIRRSWGTFERIVFSGEEYKADCPYLGTSASKRLVVGIQKDIPLLPFWRTQLSAPELPGKSTEAPVETTSQCNFTLPNLVSLILL